MLPFFGAIPQRLLGAGKLTAFVTFFFSLSEIASVKLVKQKQKAEAKRKATPVVGDMQPLMEALPELSELTKGRKQPKACVFFHDCLFSYLQGSLVLSYTPNLFLWPLQLKGPQVGGRGLLRILCTLLASPQL